MIMQYDVNFCTPNFGIIFSLPTKYIEKVTALAKIKKTPNQKFSCMSSWVLPQNATAIPIYETTIAIAL